MAGIITLTTAFVAPDNGVLSYVIQQFIRGRLKGRSPFKNYSSPLCKEYISILWRGGLRG